MKKKQFILFPILAGLFLGSFVTAQPAKAAVKLPGSKLSITNIDDKGVVTSKRYERVDGQDVYVIKGKAKKKSKVYIIADKDGNDPAHASRITTAKVSKKGKWKVQLYAIDKIEADYYVTQDKRASHKKSKIVDANLIEKKIKLVLPPNKGTEPKPFVASEFATDITYDQLARTPDSYKNKKVYLEGSVLQTSDTQLLVLVQGNSDQIIHVKYDSADLNGSRVLENDLIQIYATAKGTFTYTTTNGDDNTIPTLTVVKLIDKGTAPDDYGY